MTERFEYVDAGAAAITSKIRGELTSDGERFTSAHIALQVAVPGNTDGVILTGGRDELIELGSRIIQEATIAELRREGAFKK